MSITSTPITVSKFSDSYNGALKVSEAKRASRIRVHVLDIPQVILGYRLGVWTVCLCISAQPTMCANDRLLQTRNTSDDDDDVFNQPLLVHILASRSLIDEPKKKEFHQNSIPEMIGL